MALFDESHNSLEYLKKVLDRRLGRPPDIITHDGGKVFIEKAFRSKEDLLQIETKEVPIEIANAISVVERHPTPLRRAYAIIKSEDPRTDDDDALQMVIKRLNDSNGPYELVLTLLLYGTLPMFEILGEPLHPSVYERAKAKEKGTNELSKL